jgi:glycosyltransferase involved in cell wall biosynthesis
MGSKRLKILYVCPLAHYSGHYPYAAVAEPRELAKAGASVSLLTFCGITGNPDVSVPHLQTAKDNAPSRLLRRFTFGRWLTVLFEIAATLGRAIRLCRKHRYDAIYLRDGQPLMFLSHLLSLPFHGIRWAVSVTGSDIFVPKMEIPRLRDRLTHYSYVFGQNFFHGGAWKPLYGASMGRNSFVLVAQNEDARRGYEECFGGVFAGRVRCVPLGVSDDNAAMPKDEARARLGLPKDKTVLLSFGTPHYGKKLETVFEAVGMLDNVFLVQAGRQSLSLGESPYSMGQRYGLDGKLAIFDRYIGEDDEDRACFFASADAVVMSYTKEFRSTSSMLWQAARYGLPVIASNANVLGEMVRDYDMGLLFRAEDAVSLAEAVLRFGKLGKRDFGWMERGRARFLEDYSHRKWAERTIEICKG